MNTARMADADGQDDMLFIYHGPVMDSGVKLSDQKEEVVEFVACEAAQADGLTVR